MKQVISPWVTKWLFVKMTTQLKIICGYHGYRAVIIKTWYKYIVYDLILYTHKTNANSNINPRAHRPNITLYPIPSTVFDAKLPLSMTHADFQLPGNQVILYQMFRFWSHLNANCM